MRKKEQVQRERQAYIYTEGVLGMRPMLERDTDGHNQTQVNPCV